MFANHGSLEKHKHKIEGINSRMDGMQAAILSVKLKYIERWTESRIQNANYYNHYLRNKSDIIIPKTHNNAKHVFHLYVIKSDIRDKLTKLLEKHGIAYGIHYPKALPFLDSYKYLSHDKKDFPVAYNLPKKILSLPLYPELTEEMIEYISSCL